MRPEDRWLPLPKDVLPGQYRVGEWLRVSDGTVVKVVARSTQMLLVRPMPWWRQLVHRWFG